MSESYFLAGYGHRDLPPPVQNAIGKTIHSLHIHSAPVEGSTDIDSLRFSFTDGTQLTISDKGQSCCEWRYISTDDDLKSFVGSVFRGLDVKNGPETETDGSPHETMFLEIQTDRGVFTVVTHNIHNGYYGGFSLQAE